MTISTSINDLNANTGLKIITSFLSIKETSRLRSSSSKFRTEIPNVPEEAKAFLIFESHLPMIQDIIQRTENYDRELTLRRETDAALWRCLSSPYLIVPFFGAPPIILLMGGCTLETMGKCTLETISIAASFFVFPPSFGCAFLLGRRSWMKSQESALRQLWIKFRNQPPPQDLITAAHDLKAELENHQRLYAAYREPGGMDRYYATVGIDRALEEIQIHLS